MQNYKSSFIITFIAFCLLLIAVFYQQSTINTQKETIAMCDSIADQALEAIGLAKYWQEAYQKEIITNSEKINNLFYNLRHEGYKIPEIAKMCGRPISKGIKK